MRYCYIKEEEIEKVHSMFILMNQLRDINSTKYIKNKMDRYKLIGNVFHCSFETIRKIFTKTLTYKTIRQGKYVYQNYYYDPEIYLTKLNNKRKKRIKDKAIKQNSKYYKVAQFVRQVARTTNNKTSAKVLSKLLWDELHIYYSPKHLYWLVRYGRLNGVTLRIFPYLRRGKYYKRPPIATKRYITTPILYRDDVINNRMRFGDVEVDTVEGKKGDRFCLSTMIDRKSRRLAITMYESKKSDEFTFAVNQNINKMTTKVLSITSDNGTENANLNELNIPWFATDAYSSWQKGTIEQKHKQFRKFFEKGRSFKNLNQEMCDLIALIINAETHLQNPILYPLGFTITERELQIYKELIWRKEPHKVFKI